MTGDAPGGADTDAGPVPPPAAPPRSPADARAVIVGAGGLGCPAAAGLAAAGVRAITVLDDDTIELSNLQRQPAHTTRGAADRAPKAPSLRATVEALTPWTTVDARAERLHPGNAVDLLRGADVVIEGSDNLPTKFLVSDAAVRAGVPVVHGGILRFQGQVFARAATGAAAEGAPAGGRAWGPCYRCLFEEPPPDGEVLSCSEAGVVGALAGWVGALQAEAAVEILRGEGGPAGRLLLVDGLEPSVRAVRVPRNPACRACGTADLDIALEDYRTTSGADFGRDCAI